MSNVREYIRDRPEIFGTLLILFIVVLCIFGLSKAKESADKDFVSGVTKILNEHTTKVYDQAYWDGMNDTLIHIKMTGTNKVLEITDMLDAKAARIEEYNKNGGVGR
jgi:hypothetical protein